MLIVVRHGRTPANAAGQLLGRATPNSTNSAGRRLPQSASRSRLRLA